jgi:hypothetical protein
MLKMSEHNEGEVDYVKNLQRRARTVLADLRNKSPLNFWLIQNLDTHPTNHHQLGSPVIPPTVHVSTYAHKLETDEEMNQKFMEFHYSDRVRIRYLVHPDAHFTEEELRSGHYISVSEFNDGQRENDKEYYHRLAGLNDQIVQHRTSGLSSIDLKMPYATM